LLMSVRCKLEESCNTEDIASTPSAAEAGNTSTMSGRESL